VTERPQELRIGYHRDIDAITSKVVRLFALVSEAIAAANEALLGDDQDALAAVRRGETTIDDLMVELEGDIERLLLLQAPVAGELRYALAIIRIVPELERSGDLAEHIAKRAGSGLAAQLTPSARGMLERMGTLAAELWRSAADGFIDRDPGAGEALERADDEIDDLHTALTSELLSGGLPAPVAADATLVARFYERLGDHAVHIATRVANAVS
jgi:phosphate transport system protein